MRTVTRTRGTSSAPRKISLGQRLRSCLSQGIADVGLFVRRPSLQTLRGNSGVAYTLMLMPIIFLAGLLVVAAVNVPYWDQWEFVPLLQHLHHGHVYFFQDFWHQHNEHRIFFPRLVMVAFAYLTHWNIRVESAISFTIAIGSFIFVLKILGDTWRKTKHKALWLLPFISLIWFSPVQMENWLWGWQIQWFMSIFGMVLVVWGLSRIKDRKVSASNLLLMLGGGVLAMYSLGNGIVVWPVLIAALVYLRVSWLKVGLTAATGFAASAIYYVHYISPTGTGSKTLFLDEPVLFVKYVLTYLGRPLSFVHDITPLLGFILAVTFVALCTYLFVKKRTVFTAVLPWVALGLYVAGSAVLTAMSRMGLGLNQAYSSRYITVSSLLLISTLVIGAEWWQTLTKKARWWHGSMVAVCGLVLLLVLTNFAWGIRSSMMRSHELRDNQQCTHEAHPTDACLLYTFPDVPAVKQRLNYLKQVHWGGY